MINRLTTLIMSLMACMANVSAEDITLGQPVETSSFSYEGTFTLDRTTDVYYDGPNWSWMLVDGQEGTFVSYSGTYGNICKWTGLEAGQHTFSSQWLGGTFMFYTVNDDAEITLLSANPEAGSSLSPWVNGSGDVVLRFSESVVYTSAYVKAGDVTSATISGTTSENIQHAVRIKDPYLAMYQDGTLTKDGGQAVSLVLEGVQTPGGKLMNGNGTLKIDYVSAPYSISLSSSVLGQGTYFKSYYPEGDPEGIFTFTFDGEVCAEAGYVPYLTLGIGNLETDGEYYYEVADATVNGNTVTVDLTGKNRRPAIAACGDFNGEYFAFKLCNVYDTSHNMAVSSSDSNVGSFPFSLIYQEIPESVVAYEFTPGNGSSLADATTINLWMSNFSTIQSYDGLLFTYNDGTEPYLIPVSQLVNTALEADEAEFTVNVPQYARTHAVTVSIANPVSLDGYDKHIYARYNQMVITYSSPIKEYGTYSEIADNAIVTFAVNKDTDFLFYDIVDAEGNGYASGQCYSDNDGYFSFQVPCKILLENGQTYSLVVSDADDTTSIEFYGNSKEFDYSPVVFVSVDPDPENALLSPDNRVITVTYDGMVKIHERMSGVPGDGGMLPFEKIEGVDAEDGYAQTWKLTLSENLVAGYSETVEVWVNALDSSDLVVEGDLGTNSYADCKVFNYNVENSGVNSIEADEAGNGRVYNLQGIEVTGRDLPAGVYIQDGKKILVK
ncbi:MAG: hypothetical protein LUC85_12220 [Bacteroidales bacterium]|nr:hypothetical protein [Bacteroidales bacterium]MCD8395566.1 hypothetical protein [Bacteroidales bacterium]